MTKSKSALAMRDFKLANSELSDHEDLCRHVADGGNDEDSGMQSDSSYDSGDDRGGNCYDSDSEYEYEEEEEESDEDDGEEEEEEEESDEDGDEEEDDDDDGEDYGYRSEY